MNSIDEETSKLTDPEEENALISKSVFSVNLNGKV
tara:strand:- start:112 stop:216 length:105 start_codon:yes stop_codon:yes gene_type:complete